MNIYSSSESRKIDNHAIVDLGIPGTLLMDNAGIAVAEKAMKMLSGIHGKNVLIITGKGNNGGDGYVAARVLTEFGMDVTVHTTVNKDSISGDSQYFYEKCLYRNVNILHLKNPDSVDPTSFDIIIDGLLGTGIKGEVRSDAKKWITWMNNSGKSILSIDIPSGISADNGQILGAAVKADATVTMGFIKQGLVLNPGAEYTGDLEVADIGFPDAAFETVDSDKQLFDESIPNRYLSKPPSDTYKHRQGKVFVLAGSRGYTGAACLTAQSALRAGAGLVILGIPESLNSIFEQKLTEVITAPLPDTGNGEFCAKAVDSLEKYLDWCDVVALGPGIGLNPETQLFVENFVRKCTKPIVLDADALVPFRNNHDLFGGILGEYVITPHYGEASALMDMEKSRIIEDPLIFLNTITDKTGGIVVLKGSPTIVGTGSKSIVNTSGNQGLATGGSGDVLTGVIASFIAQKMPLDIASSLGVFIHGRCADSLLNSKGYRGLVAGDLIHTLPFVISQYEIY